MAIVTVLPDPEALAAATAARVTSLIEQSIEQRQSAVVCLTGGKTLQRCYPLLASANAPWRQRIDWRRIHLFWSDERHVAPDHIDSNYRMASRAFVTAVPIPAEHVHRIRAELPDAAAAARAYEATLREGFLLAGRSDQTFDAVLLGLGEDSHIASIFPGSLLLNGADSSQAGGDRVAAVWADHLGAWRITLTPHTLLDARAIMVVASGESKAEAVRAALDLPTDLARWPAQLLRAADDRVEWFIDAAAARLRAAPREPPSSPTR